ncbi:MAG: hypothetical protein WC123_02460 [Bacilli bacterium]|nr:hypothetical protein [Endomicrobiaceae bacterium]MDD3383850.1 hypothetical protein [Bacilli bacterium]
MIERGFNRPKLNSLIRLNLTLFSEDLVKDSLKRALEIFSRMNDIEKLSYSILVEFMKNQGLFYNEDYKIEKIAISYDNPKSGFVSVEFSYKIDGNIDKKIAYLISFKDYKYELAIENNNIIFSNLPITTINNLIKLHFLPDNTYQFSLF